MAKHIVWRQDNNYEDDDVGDYEYGNKDGWLTDVRDVDLARSLIEDEVSSHDPFEIWRTHNVPIVPN